MISRNAVSPSFGIAYVKAQNNLWYRPDRGVSVAPSDVTADFKANEGNLILSVSCPEVETDYGNTKGFKDVENVPFVLTGPEANSFGFAKTPDAQKVFFNRYAGSWYKFDAPVQVTKVDNLKEVM